MAGAGVGQVVPGAVPGAAMDPSFGGAQEPEAANAPGAAPYPYPTMSNGGGVPHY